MFETLKPAPTDKILALIGLYRADPRPNKVDLGVGVYKDSAGKTVVMRAVREAEKRLFQSQDTKTYLGLAGDTAFNAAMIGLVFGDGADTGRIRAVQAPGGSGALRLVAELLQRLRPGATVWMSDPTWPNHQQVQRLRDEHAVYMVGDSRINVAGLPEGKLDDLAKAIVAVLD